MKHLTLGMRWCLIATLCLCAFIVTIWAVSQGNNRADDRRWQQCVSTGHSPSDCSKALGWSVTP